MLLRWLYKQGAVVLEKSAEEMLALMLLRRSPVCDRIAAEIVTDRFK